VGPLKLALFDLDGTLTKEKSAWEFIHRHLDVWEGHAEKFQEAFLKGEISYKRFCQLDAAIWKGMKVAELERILRKIPLYAGLDELAAYLRSSGMKLAIISTGLALLADRVATQYGFDYAVANELGAVNGRLNGEIKINVHFNQKRTWVRKIMDRFKVRKKEILAVGDSSGDLGMFVMAGFSVAFNSACDPLRKIATLCLDSSDLRDLIPPLSLYLEDQKISGQYQIPKVKPFGSVRSQIFGKSLREKKNQKGGRIYDCPQCRASNFAPPARLRMRAKAPLVCWKCGAEIDGKIVMKRDLNGRRNEKKK
jgi:phosphoserine phosphatase